MASNDQVVVKRVEVVMPGPLVDDLDCLELGRPLGQGGPYDVLELVIARVEIVPVDGGIVQRRAARQEEAPLGPAENARGVDHQWQAPPVHGRRALGRAGAVEDEQGTLARFDRNVQARHPRRQRRAWAGGVDDRPGLDRGARLQRDRGHAVAFAPDGHHLVGDVIRALFARLGLEAVHQPGVVEPPFPRTAIGRQQDVIDVQMREGARQILLPPQHHVGAAGTLDLVVLAQRPCLRLGPRQEQIAAGMEVQVRRGFACDLHGVGKASDERAAELADPDIDRVRELNPDRGRGQRGRRLHIAGVTLDHQHAAGEVWVRSQEIGDGRSDHRPADDHHVIAVLHVAASSSGWPRSTNQPPR